MLQRFPLLSPPSSIQRQYQQPLPANIHSRHLQYRLLLCTFKNSHALNNQTLINSQIFDYIPHFKPTPIWTLTDQSHFKSPHLGPHSKSHTSRWTHRTPPSPCSNISPPSPPPPPPSCPQPSSRTASASKTWTVRAY